MSISHIANLLERSSRTIHRILSKNSYIHKLYDKRKWPNRSRIHGETYYRRMKGVYLWFLELWKEGIINDINLLSGESLEGEPP